MKRSYIKMLIFGIFIIIVSLLNSFVSNILNGYMGILFLLLMLIIFKYVIGFEKDRHRGYIDVIYELFIYLVIFYIIYYLLGILLSFQRGYNYFNVSGIFMYIIPLILNIVLVEVLRYNMLRKGEDNIPLYIFVTIVMIFLSVSGNLYMFKNLYSLFMFIALSLLPSISLNILCSYLSIKVGYKPVIFLRLMLTLVPLLMPIYPNPNDYIKALVGFILPIGLLVLLIKYFGKYSDKEVSREYRKHKISLLFVPVILSSIIIYLVSGYFRYTAIAIASDSMKDVISRGDVVIVKNPNITKEKPVVGDIIAFKYNGKIIVHRIVRIKNDNEVSYFYTKGDANNIEDNYKIEFSDIVGIVKLKIDKIGYPTVWLSEIE